MVTPCQLKGCIYCGNPNLSTLPNGSKYCDKCKSITVEAVIKEKYGDRY